MSIRDRLRRAYRREFVDEVAEGFESLAKVASANGEEYSANLIRALIADLREHAEKPKR